MYALANISVSDAELDEINTKNELRKKHRTSLYRCRFGKGYSMWLALNKINRLRNRMM